jgi:ABC-2 type transport system ATP-binding protein
MDEAESYADEIAIINKGKIVALGKSEELRRYLGGEIITFTIDKTTLEPNMIQRMQRLSFVKNVFENGNLSVLVSDVEFTLPRLMSFLKDEGVYVEKVFVTKPSLDDVFLKYAGTRVEEKGRISDVTHIRTMIRKG